MKNKKYLLLGFDLKIKMHELASVDLCIWKQNKDSIEALYLQGGEDNFFQLLSANLDIVEKITGKETIAMAVLIDKAFLHIVEDKFGKYDYQFITLESLLDRKWFIQGIDIVDIDGLFSFFGMDVRYERTELLSNDDKVNDYVELANKLIPEHSPFLPCMILTYQKI